MDNEKPLTPVTEPDHEPREVVSWYIPQKEEEVVSYYVHHQPLPSAMSAPPVSDGAGSARRRRIGLWISLGVVALLLAVAVAGSFLFRVEEPALPEGEDSASSIVDIFSSDAKTTIPVSHEKTDFRFRLATETPAEELTATEVFAKVNPAVVMVLSQQGNRTYLGTGIMMTPDGYLLTNAHVVAGGSSCQIVLDSGVFYDCELVGMDEARDLAVLHALDAGNLPTAEFANSDYCWVGDTVYVIGNPLGVQFRCTLTNGILSGIQRQLTVDGTEMTMLQTTAAVNSGNSGGPLINAYGQVIGIVTLKWSNTAVDAHAATIEGMGFAIPTVDARYVVNALLKDGEFKGLPTLGITVKTDTSGDSSSLIVQEVTPGYGGAKAGVQAGDIILAADGVPVSTTDDLLQARDLHTVGESLTLTLQRGEDQLTLEIPISAPSELK